MIDILKKYKRLTSLEEDFKKIGIPLPYELRETRKIFESRLFPAETSSVRKKVFESKSPLRSSEFYAVLCEDLKKDLKRYRTTTRR